MESLHREKDALGEQERRVPRHDHIEPPPGYANGGIPTDYSFKVPDRLAELGKLYRGRNAVYGDTYKNFGKVMVAFFPNGVNLNSTDEWNRMALFFHVADKLARYASSFERGGHVDSLDDAAVYAMMLQEFDHDMKERSK